jgi:hypothetical protein
MVTLSTSSLLLRFIRFLPGEENRFHPMLIQFNAGLEKQAKTIETQRRIDNLSERDYAGLITTVEYLDSSSFVVSKRKKMTLFFFLSLNLCIVSFSVLAFIDIFLFTICHSRNFGIFPFDISTGNHFF